MRKVVSVYSSEELNKWVRRFARLEAVRRDEPVSVSQVWVEAMQAYRNNQGAGAEELAKVPSAPANTED